MPRYSNLMDSRDGRPYGGFNYPKYSNGGRTYNNQSLLARQLRKGQGTTIVTNLPTGVRHIFLKND